MNDKPFVLVVEDDAVNRMLTTRILSARGIPYDVAVDGREALTKVAELHPDLILMDLTLPVYDGWEVTRRIRNDPAFTGIRIVAVTAPSMSVDRKRILRAGFDGYLPKPYRPTDLLTAIVPPDMATEATVTVAAGAA